MFKDLITYFVVSLLAHGAVGQTSIPRFIVKKISSHVYIAHPEKLNRINNTSSIIIDKDFLTVIDAQPDIRMGRLLIKAIRQKISKKPIRYLILTHSHLDHVLGTASFVKAYPSVSIIAQAHAIEDLKSRSSAEKTGWAKALLEKAALYKDSAIHSTGIKKKNLTSTAKELNIYASDVKASAIVLPQVMVSDSLTIGNQIPLKIRYLGHGHTTGDLIILLPSENVLITGDLVHDYDPYFNDADIDKWLAILDTLNHYPFQKFIGCHGEAHNSKQIINLWKNYIEELRERTLGAIKSGQTLEAFKKTVTLLSLRSLRDRQYGDRIIAFRKEYMGDAIANPLQEAVRSQIDHVWKYYAGK